MTSAQIGVVTIPRDPKCFIPDGFQRLYEVIGSNTGNMMFSEAVYRLVEGDLDRVTHLSPEQINERYEFVVVPAANWLRDGVDLSWRVQFFERIEVPIVTIGIGLQATTADLGAVSVSDTALKLARVLAEKSAFLSVRGDFTRDWLNSVGIKNVVTTGCPSLYMRVGEDESSVPSPIRDQLAVQSTRYMIKSDFAEGDSIHRRLFEVAASTGCDMIFQSEIEEMHFLTYGAFTDSLTDHTAQLLSRCYGLTTFDSLKAYLQSHGRVFYNLTEWSRYLKTVRGQIGTRLHGTILAMNSGVPGILIAHDSRTSELVDFADIPTMTPDQATKFIRSRKWDQFSVEAHQRYCERRAENAKVFIEFLKSNGLEAQEGNILK